MDVSGKRPERHASFEVKNSGCNGCCIARAGAMGIKGFLISLFLIYHRETLELNILAVAVLMKRIKLDFSAE